MNRSERPRKNFLQKYYGIFVGLFAALLIWTLCGHTVKDFWLGLAYEPVGIAAEIREDLELTGRGRRIFDATNLVVEDSQAFNTHCQSHDEGVSLLGCYTDGRIYVYEITNEQLMTANKVTAAHELLHAVWERMNPWERDEIEGWLREVYDENRAWFDEELEFYNESEHLEEIYTRAATKLADLPEGLEQHYAKYFRDRAKIVKYYQEYEAPFLVLRLEMEELAEKIEKIGAEIEAERTEYFVAVEELNQAIEAFNNCAGVAGCFKSEAEFAGRRSAIVAEQAELENFRERLNQKITENNERIMTYRERQTSLGDLNAAMNSNVELVDEI